MRAIALFTETGTTVVRGGERKVLEIELV